MNQKGIAPIIIILLLTIIGGSGFFVVKNFPKLDYPLADIKVFKYSSPSASLKSSPAGKSIQSNKQSPTPKGSTSTTSTTQSNNSGSSTTSGNSGSGTNTTTSSTSQKSTVTGTVKDTSGKTIGGAAIQFSCNGCRSLRNGDFQDEQADSNGKFTVSNLPATTLTLKPFYGTWGESKTITTKSGETFDVTLIVSALTSATTNPSPSSQTYTTPSLRITSPNGGESVKVGDKMTITWEANWSSWARFSLMYSDCDSCAGNIATVEGNNARSYEWTVAVGNIDGPRKYKIWIVGYTNGYQGPTPQDKSDSEFTVTK